jgi:hypothetical protein
MKKKECHFININNMEKERNMHKLSNHVRRVLRLMGIQFHGNESF